MSCTIFYKGNLKSEYTFDDVVSIVQKYAEVFECSLNIKENMIEIEFFNGKSEPLVLDFKNNKIEGFCKWNGNNKEEYYKILDMFIELRPLFKQYKVDDDLGIWNSYLVQSKPCKIKKYDISIEQELKLLQRSIDNTHKEYSDTELELLNIMYQNGEIIPFSENICRLIVQDFIKLFNIKSLTTEKRNQIINEARELNEFNQYLSFREENFTFEFIYMMVAIWISYYLSYKNKGVVKDLPNDIRGFASSKLAGLYGILSNFLNCHSGVINSKHAEINKFIAQSTLHNSPFSVSQLGADIELELLISVLNYLGFSYMME